MKVRTDLCYLLDSQKFVVDQDQNLQQSPKITGRKINSCQKLRAQKSLYKTPVNIVEIKQHSIKSPIHTSPRERSIATSNKPSPKPTASTESSSKRLNSPTNFKQIKKNQSSPQPVKTIKTQKIKDKKPQIKAEPETKKTVINPSKLKKLICQTLIKTQQDKFLLQQKEIEEKKSIEDRKEKLKETNNIIREKNAKITKKTGQLHKAAWGVDQRQFEDRDFASRNSNLDAELRERKRAEHQKMLEEGRARIGLDLYPKFKTKRRKLSSDLDKPTEKRRSPDPKVQLWMKLKKKQKRNSLIQEKFKEILQERDRQKALEELIKKQKEDAQKAKKTKKLKRNLSNPSLNRKLSDAEAFSNSDIDEKLRDFKLQKENLMKRFEEIKNGGWEVNSEESKSDSEIMEKDVKPLKDQDSIEKDKESLKKTLQMLNERVKKTKALLVSDELDSGGESDENSQKWFDPYKKDSNESDVESNSSLDAEFTENILSNLFHPETIKDVPNVLYLLSPNIQSSEEKSKSGESQENKHEIWKKIKERQKDLLSEIENQEDFPMSNSSIESSLITPSIDEASPIDYKYTGDSISNRMSDIEDGIKIYKEFDENVMENGEANIFKLYENDRKNKADEVVSKAEARDFIEDSANSSKKLNSRLDMPLAKANSYEINQESEEECEHSPNEEESDILFNQDSNQNASGEFVFTETKDSSPYQKPDDLASTNEAKNEFIKIIGGPVEDQEIPSYDDSYMNEPSHSFSGLKSVDSTESFEERNQPVIEYFYYEYANTLILYEELYCWVLGEKHTTDLLYFECYECQSNLPRIMPIIDEVEIIEDPQQGYIYITEEQPTDVDGKDQDYEESKTMHDPYVNENVIKTKVSLADLREPSLLGEIEPCLRISDRLENNHIGKEAFFDQIPDFKTIQEKHHLLSLAIDHPINPIPPHPIPKPLIQDRFPPLTATIKEIESAVNTVISSEIDLYLQSIPHRTFHHEVNPNLEFIEQYLESMLFNLLSREDEILDTINTPIYTDPLIKLAIIHNADPGSLSKFPRLDLIVPEDIEPILSLELNPQGYVSLQIYLQMLGDCVNEALNLIRPYGMKGVPDPWSNHKRILFGESQLTNVYEKVKDHLYKWVNTRGGIFPPIHMDEKRLVMMREEKMSTMLMYDVEDEESDWVEYEDEETQAKLDVADMILESLIDETSQILNLIM
ncbi:unnamed protein product [Blepharisma stoltei]|uniref:DUF4378 domain-containing protein n=1 Tax=Blepharisma stoltei TaxID=1481888 RepID=A0AAU9JKM7_9CILI|nr:unnamed protein product [Blepharisma stoltei]